MKPGYLIAIICLFLTACTSSSGVMEFSPNRYSLSVDVDSEFYGPTSARKQAFEEAQAFCRSKGQALSVDTIDLHSSNTYTTAAIVFHCVEP